MELSRAVVSDQGTPLKNEAFYTNYPRKLIDLIWSPLASLRSVSHTLYNDILHIVHCGIIKINDINFVFTFASIRLPIGA